MPSRLLFLLCTVAALTSCGDPTRVRARLEPVSDTLTVFALSGTPLSVPTALNTALRQVVRADPAFNYDVVFDINEAGRAVIYPPLLVGPFGSAGIQKSTLPFDQLLEAPVSGYDASAAVEVNPGETVVIRAASTACARELNAFIYSKLVVDSVNTTVRTIHFRLRVDPNCGFRSFAEGIPEE